MDKYGNPKEIKVTLPDCLKPLGLAGVEINLTEPNTHCELGCLKTIELEKEAVKEHANLLVDLIKKYSEGTLQYSIEAESEHSNLRIDSCGARFGIDGKYESSLFTKKENQTLWTSDIEAISNELLVRLIEEFVALDGMKFTLVVFDERTLADDEDENEEDEDDSSDEEHSLIVLTPEQIEVWYAANKLDPAVPLDVADALGPASSADPADVPVPNDVRLVSAIKSEYVPAHIKVTLPECLSPLGLSGPVIFTNDSICGDEDFTIARDLDSETVKSNCDLILQLIRQYRIGDDVVFSLSAEINGDGNGEQNSNGDTDAELSITYAEVRVYLDDDSIANFPKIDVEPLRPSSKSDYTFHLDDMTDDDIKTLLEYFFKREASEYTLAVEHEEPTHDQIREWYAANGLHSVDACVAIATAEMKSLF